MIIRQLGFNNWYYISKKMHTFTKNRTFDTCDEIWFVEHPSIFTQGKGEKKLSVVNNINIPTVQTNRGGKITYHGPGQQMMYFLINLKRLHLPVQKLIEIMQQTVINSLSYFGVQAHVYPGAPGVYIQNKKICSLGLRIERGFSLYGLALNVRMDLSPFLYINPCGIPGLKMTKLSYFIPNITMKKVRTILIQSFLEIFSFKSQK